MSVHPMASVGFQRTAAAYTRGRPSYPSAAIAWLSDVLGLVPGATVLDVAAGTGKLTELLLPTGAHVVAVEPVAAMREELAARLPSVAVREGTAEALPLAGPVDAITVGQAFHWFDGPAALREFHRVLRPGGRLALVWNVRDHADPVWGEVDRIIEPHRGSTPQHADGAWRPALEASRRFHAVGQRRLAHEHELSHGGLVDRIGSTSFIAALEEPARTEVLEQVRAVAARRPEPLVLAYQTEIHLLVRAPS